MFDRDRYDIVVVGGGPAGAIAAKESAERGASVLLIEERRGIGLPIQCTGLLSVRGFGASGACSDVILREIKGVVAHGPAGQRVVAEQAKTHAYVMDRDRFDCDLIAQAKRSGVEVRFPARATGLEPGLIHVEANGVKRAIQAKVVIGADGPNSRVAQWAGLRPPEKLIIAIQVTIPYQPEHEDYVEVYLGKEIAPHFFAWAVPSLSGYARVGLGTDDPKITRQVMDRFLNAYFPECKIMGFNAGSIPIGPVEKSVADGVVLVGDAAGQAKPTSGGGIYTGVSCAKIAAEVVTDAIKANSTRVQDLMSYEKRWRDSFEMELRFGMMAHEYLCKLSDDDIVAIFKAASDPEICQLIGEHGDIDYPSKLAKAILARPGLWHKLLHKVPLDMDLIMKALRHLI